MKIRYYIDPDTQLPHIYNHNVNEDEVEAVIRRPGEDRLGRENARVAIGQTAAGRYLKVIYVLEYHSKEIFVITAYEINGNVLKAYRRRKRRKK